MREEEQREDREDRGKREGEGTEERVRGQIKGREKAECEGQSKLTESR